LWVGTETLRKCVVQAQIDAGDKRGATSEELEELKALKAEVRDLREANDPQGCTIFFTRELDPHRR
jgi:transposase-like protein